MPAWFFRAVLCPVAESDREDSDDDGDNQQKGDKSKHGLNRGFVGGSLGDGCAAHDGDSDTDDNHGCHRRHNDARQESFKLHFQHLPFTFCSSCNPLQSV